MGLTESKEEETPTVESQEKGSVADVAAPTVPEVVVEPAKPDEPAKEPEPAKPAEMKPAETPKPEEAPKTPEPPKTPEAPKAEPKKAAGKPGPNAPKNDI